MNASPGCLSDCMTASSCLSLNILAPSISAHITGHCIQQMSPSHMACAHTSASHMLRCCAIVMILLVSFSLRTADVVFCTADSTGRLMLCQCY
jgi:hypothetical protein